MISSTHQLLDYRDFRPFSATFIETGSGGGDGIRRALDAGFLAVHSIEADPHYFRVCKELYLEDARVHLHLGESQRRLAWILADISEPSVVFLDAHPAGETTYGHRELLQGDMSYGQDAVIRQELEILLARDEQHVIILDDINGDELTANTYAGMILKRFPAYRFSFYDQEHYPDKLLVAVPEEL